MLKVNIPLFAAIAMTMTAFAPASSLAAESMARSNQFWWPDQLSLQPLRAHSPESNPYGDNFNYAEAFNSVDLKELKSDIEDFSGLVASRLGTLWRSHDQNGLAQCRHLPCA